LHDELRSGAPRSITDEQVAEVVYKTLQTKPDDETQWSVRTMGEESGLSKDAVHRIWRTFGLQPHRQEHFKLSTDPFFVDKVRDIVGLARVIHGADTDSAETSVGSWRGLIAKRCVFEWRAQPVGVDR